VTPVLANTGEAYVAAAYLVFLALLLIYFAIMATRVSRVERELRELGELAAKRGRPAADGGGEEREDDRNGVAA
jgi:hypothetical protein